MVMKQREETRSPRGYADASRDLFHCQTTLAPTSTAPCGVDVSEDVLETLDGLFTCIPQKQQSVSAVLAMPAGGMALMSRCINDECHHVGSGRLHVSVLLPGEGSAHWRRIGSDIWQFDKVDLVS
ncbi:unnamed protein product [Pleuronectes platessa]|uniref:Uncharacterized protein n=1 Tax=Pleuronectes platessa TaxID=8262 RepID=A0A9N7Z4N2_PLEPL|nr:unnamed protein product [Pleuronectes platessa]